jgi:RNA recognition motif-containing protein
MGRYLDIEQAKAKGAEGASKSFGGAPQNGNLETPTIFVGNMNFRTTEDSLRRAFEGYGAINSVRIAMDQETQRPKGFAHIEFASNEAAKKALELNGQDVDGR